jgi:hypothetical protein
MTSILGSSSFEGVKEFFVFYILIVGNVAMIGVIRRKLDQCYAMMIEDC